MRDLKDYQESYVALPFEDTQVKYRRKKTLETIEALKPNSILEIGCGMDATFNYYDDYDAFTVVEPCEQFCDHATLESAGNDNITIVKGTVQETIEQLTSKSYDLILLTSLLHEIPDNKGMLEAVAQLCSKDTVIHINVPNAKSFHRLLAQESGLIDSIYQKSAVQKKMQQSHTFDLSALGELVASAGFKVIEQGSFFIKPFTHGQMAALQAAGVLTDAILNGLYAMSKHLPECGSEIFMNIQLKD